MKNPSLLSLLQLTNSTLPIGAYSYSEGLETLVDFKKINNKETLEHWLNQELHYGAIRLETAVMTRAFTSVKTSNLEKLSYWNKWLTAARETEELRHQSWQMGYSLMRLIQEIQPETIPIVTACGNPCNYAIAFGLISAYWEIDLFAATLGYLHSWASNLVNAGVKLIPLGQTAGQQIILNLHSNITHAAQEVLNLDDNNLNSCGWGLALASMAHETQYTRLFRS
ncbi:MAG: urease accessory protein UreF [Crinalium sp.]